MKLKQLVPAFALIAGIAGSASASSLGVVEYTSHYAFWDTFTSSTGYPTVTVTDQAANSFESSLFSATLSANMAGSTPGSGNRIYSGTGATGNDFAFGVAGVINAATSVFTLQLKVSGPLQNVAVEDNILPAGEHFTVTADPSWGTATKSYVGYSTELTSAPSTYTTFYIYSWIWTGLDLEASDTFAIDVTSADGHVSLDALRLDAAAIPEPSAFAALAGLGVLGLAATRRRRA